MSVFNIPQHTYVPGTPVTAGPFAKPAGAKLASLQLATPTDWTTGTAGRVLDVLVTKSTGGSAEGSVTTPQLAKDEVSLPTILEMDVSADPANATYSVVVTASVGSIKCAGTLTVV